MAVTHGSRWSIQAAKSQAIQLAIILKMQSDQP